MRGKRAYAKDSIIIHYATQKEGGQEERQGTGGK